MPNLIRFLLAPMMFCVTLHCAHPQPSVLAAPDRSIELPSPLARVLREYEDAWRQRDAAALAELFDERGYVLQNGRPPVQGRAAIRKAYEGAGGPLILRAFAFEVEGSIAYILGGFALAEGEPAIGKFTLTLRREGGGPWMIVSDMDNGNRPPRPR